MRKDKNLKVIYIAGNGHSGSTLLDIIVGSAKDTFSAGELTNIARDGIKNEYCSCNEMIENCEIWSKVWIEWMKRSNISIDQYREYKLKFERNKSTIQTIKNYVLPGREFKMYCNATLQLFKSIQKITGNNTIIDSSKGPQRILVLSRIFSGLKIIHLCRSFSGIFNSGRKHHKKDLSKGVEQDILPRRPAKLLIEWLFINFLTEIFSIRKSKIKVVYNHMVNDVDKTIERIFKFAKIEISDQVRKEGSFQPGHLLAGNKMRLQKEIRVSKSIGNQFSNLTKGQRKAAQIIDKIFFFWH